MNASDEQIADTVLDLCVKEFGISKDDILGKRRTAEIVLPRHFALALTYELTSYQCSLRVVALKFNRKEHKTVINAISNVRFLCREAFRQHQFETLKELTRKQLGANFNYGPLTKPGAVVQVQRVL